MPNPGRPYAVVGVYALAVALLLFWQMLPRLFENQRRHARWVLRAGTAAMTLSFFIATPLHDVCIIAGVPLGLLAFVVAIHAFLKNGERALAGLGVLSLVACVVNYLAFVFPLYPAATPTLQKLSLITFLVWVLAGMLRLEMSYVLAHASSRSPNPQ